jgi:hypothetical protein
MVFEVDRGRGRLPRRLGAAALQVEGAARDAVDARHGHHVAGGKAVEHAEKLAPVGGRACHLLAVSLRTTCAA